MSKPRTTTPRRAPFAQPTAASHAPDPPEGAPQRRNSLEVALRFRRLDQRSRCRAGTWLVCCGHAAAPSASKKRRPRCSVGSGSMSWRCKEGSRKCSRMRSAGVTPPIKATSAGRQPGLDQDLHILAHRVVKPGQNACPALALVGQVGHVGLEDHRTTTAQRRRFDSRVTQPVRLSQSQVEALRPAGAGNSPSPGSNASFRERPRCPGPEARRLKIHDFRWKPA